MYICNTHVCTCIFSKMWLVRILLTSPTLSFRPTSLSAWNPLSLSQLLWRTSMLSLNTNSSLWSSSQLSPTQPPPHTVWVSFFLSLSLSLSDLYIYSWYNCMCMCTCLYEPTLLERKLHVVGHCHGIQSCHSLPQMVGPLSHSRSRVSGKL